MAHPLVLIPGLLCTAALWRPQLDALADVADMSIADHTRHDSMAALAEDILAAAPPRFALAGLSMGGYIALEMVRQAPERVSRLALLDTNACADTPEQKKMRQDFIALAGRGKFKGVTPRLIPNLIHPDRLDDHELKLTIIHMARDTGTDVFIRQETAIMNRLDSRPYLSVIRCPTLILCGREDKPSPLSLHEEMAALIPGSELRVIERCGHLSTLERPAAVNAALREWLGR